MNGSKDNLIELVNTIESQGFNYVLGILTEDKSNPGTDNLDIYTNGSEDGLKKLLAVLKELNKSNKQSTKKLNE